MTSVTFYYDHVLNKLYHSCYYTTLWELLPSLVRQTWRLHDIVSRQEPNTHSQSNNDNNRVSVSIILLRVGFGALLVAALTLFDSKGKNKLQSLGYCNGSL